MKKIIPLIIIILVFGVYFYTNSQKSVAQEFPDSETELFLFWGEGCPHCEVVKNYIKNNNLDNQIKISYKEVYGNKDNQNMLSNIVQKCPEIDSSRGVGVPLAYSTTENKCLYGDTPIIDWLKAR